MIFEARAQPLGPLPNFVREGQLSTRKQTNCHSHIFGCPEAPCTQIEHAGGELIADLRKPGPNSSGIVETTLETDSAERSEAVRNPDAEEPMSCPKRRHVSVKAPIASRISSGPSFFFLRVARVETLGEPLVNRSKQFASLLRLALVTPEACRRQSEQ
jgi:hypothetical protein